MDDPIIDACEDINDTSKDSAVALLVKKLDENDFPYSNGASLELYELNFNGDEVVENELSYSNGYGVDVPKEYADGLDETMLIFSVADKVSSLVFDFSFVLKFSRCITSANTVEMNRSSKRIFWI